MSGVGVGVVVAKRPINLKTPQLLPSALSSQSGAASGWGGGPGYVMVRGGEVDYTNYMSR